MSKANKVITGFAVNVKYLDRTAFDKGIRKIVKTRVSPMVCQTDAALAAFIEKQLTDFKHSALLPEFEVWNATMHLGQRAQGKDFLIDAVYKSMKMGRPAPPRGSVLKGGNDA